MAINASSLAASMLASVKAKMLALYPESADAPQATKDAQEKFYKALCEGMATGIVAELTTNAEIDPAGSPAMAAGGDAVTGKGKIV